jgi:hypothetical protein
MNIRKLGILALMTMAFTPIFSSVQAAPVPVTPSPDPTGLYDATGRARWGASGFEAVLFTPGNPSPTGVQLNPFGAPAWSVGNYHRFEFTYVMATGVTTWKIDFNLDGDFLDANESASSTSPTLAGKGHKYLNLWMTGSTNAPVDVQNFTVNGTNLGGFTSNAGTTPIEWTWTDSSGFLGDVTVTGEYRMSANGSASESNRMWVRLGAALVSLQADKQKVRDDLAALLPTSNPSDDKLIEKAVEHLDKSLRGDYWIDVDSLAEKDGKKVFDEEAKAAHELLKVRGSDVSAFVLKLVEIDSQLARRAIADGSAAYTNANCASTLTKACEKAASELAKAGQELADADAARANLDYVKAIQEYRKAWSRADKAMKQLG